MKKITRTGLIVSLCVMWLCACGKHYKCYDGPELPPEKIAIVEDSKCVHLYGVDGKLLTQVEQPTVNALLPGERELRFGLSCKLGNTSVRSLEDKIENVYLEAGHRYRLEYAWVEWAEWQPTGRPSWKIKIYDITADKWIENENSKKENTIK